MRLLPEESRRDADRHGTPKLCAVHRDTGKAQRAQSRKASERKRLYNAGLRPGNRGVNLLPHENEERHATNWTIGPVRVSRRRMFGAMTLTQCGSSESGTPTRSEKLL